MSITSEKKEVRMLYDYNFHGIDCMTDLKDEVGFFGYYNGDLNHPDYRPSSAIYLKEKDAEFLYRLFTKFAKSEADKMLQAQREDFIKKLKFPEVNDLDNYEDAYRYLAVSLNQLIEELSNQKEEKI